MPAGAAPGEDRRTSTAWVPESLPLNQTIEIRRGKAILPAQLMPKEMARLEVAVRHSTDGSAIVEPAMPLFRLLTRNAPVFCTVEQRNKWGSLSRIVVVYVCLVDADRDGRFESFYDERGDHPFMPLFRGTYPKKRNAITPVAYRQVSPDTFISHFEALGVPRNERFSVFLRWTGKGFTCNVGYPRHIVLTGQIASPADPEGTCGAKVTLMPIDKKTARITLTASYPAEALGISLPWQLF